MDAGNYRLEGFLPLFAQIGNLSSRQKEGRGRDSALKAGLSPQAVFREGPESQSGSSSLKVRTPETIVETMDWRDMMSSRIAA